MKDVLADSLQSRLFACNGYLWLGLDHCFIDLASNWLMSLECRTCQQISHRMGSDVELAKQVYSGLWSKTIHHTCSPWETIAGGCCCQLRLEHSVDAAWHIPQSDCMYYLHIFCYQFSFGQTLGKHHCLGNKSEEKICFGFNHFTADMHSDPSHASLLYIFPCKE